MLTTMEYANPVYDKHIRIDSDGIINKITLDTFPIGQYTLSINGQNCCTAKYNQVNKFLEFDFTEHQSAIFTLFSDISHDDYEPSTLNRSNYINLRRIDATFIHCNANLLANESYTLTLHVYFPTAYITNPSDRTRHPTQHTMTSITLTIYPKSSCKLDLNHPTDSLDITVRPRDTTKPCSLILRINGYNVFHCDPIKIDSDLYGFRITCREYHQHFRGVQNDFLTETINQNTLNMSRVDSVQLVTINCQLVKCLQNVYIIYEYPSRRVKFSS